MKTIIMVISGLFCFLPTITGPVYAVDSSSNDQVERQIQRKNECLLVAKKCGTTVISIQDKIELLKEEIAKGKSVYTVEELEKLNENLEEVNRRLNLLLDK